MDRLLKSIGGGESNPRSESGDSPVDKLNSKLTVYIFFMFSAIITLKQHYVGEPIHCFHPSHFLSSHEKYSDALCYINNTYVLPFNEKIPKDDDDKRYIGYYQWTSLILSIQAILFYLPRGFWLTFNKKAGIDVITLTGASVDCQLNPDSESRDKIIKYIVKHMGRFLSEVNGKISMSGTLKSIFWRCYGSYLSFIYIVVKCLYVLNGIAQLFVLDLLLGLRNDLHGVNFFKHLMADDEDIVSPLFPRVAFCDFQVRYLGNVHRYTIQCSLPINLFNEKIFLAVWFWLVFISVASIGSALVWAWYCFYMPQHKSYIRTKLLTMAMGQYSDKPSEVRVRQFVQHYLRRDGILLIYFISSNSSDLIASEVVLGLWKQFWIDHERKSISIIPYGSNLLASAPPVENSLLDNDSAIGNSPEDQSENIGDVTEHWKRLSKKWKAPNVKI